jgi:hypothetical protein
MILAAKVWHWNDPSEEIGSAHHLAPIPIIVIPCVVEYLSVTGYWDAQLLCSLVEPRDYRILHRVHVLQRQRHIEVEH